MDFYFKCTPLQIGDFELIHIDSLMVEERVYNLLSRDFTSGGQGRLAWKRFIATNQCMGEKPIAIGSIGSEPSNNILCLFLHAHMHLHDKARHQSQRQKGAQGSVVYTVDEAYSCMAKPLRSHYSTRERH